MEALAALLTSLAVLTLLGVVVAFSPTLLITELTVLTRSKHAVLHSLALIAGIALAIATFCLAATVFIDPSRQLVIPSTREIIRSVPLTDILVGILLVGIGIHTSRPRPVAAKPHRFQPEKLLSTKLLFWFGFIKMLTSLSSIAAMLVAVRFILTSVGSGTLQLTSFVWLVGVATIPFVLILLMKQYCPTSFAKIQHASDRAVAFQWRRVTTTASMLLGSYFVLNGLLHWS